MKSIISPIPKEKLLAELTPEKFVRYTNFGDNKIYVFTHLDSPNLMLEVGRLREHTFRDAGGGTGKETDIDEYDTAEIPYKQLIVWDEQNMEIVGGYRFFDCQILPLDETGNIKLATSELFEFSERFIKEYLPCTIELGRSFVQTKYQASQNNRKSLYALDNLWDGISALSILHSHIRHFFGKVTMYRHYNAFARDLVLFFMKKHFPDTENLMKPLFPLPIQTSEEILNEIFPHSEYEKNHKILSKKVRELGEMIPPLINSYMSLSKTMKSFGTSQNHHFGDVEETGILVTIADIHDSKKYRHISTHSKKI